MKRRKMDWKELGLFFAWMVTIMVPALLCAALFLGAMYLSPWLALGVFLGILGGALYMAFSRPRADH